MFEIDNAIRSVYENAEVNPETGEVTLHTQRLELLEMEKEKKIEHCLLMAKEGKADIDQLGEMIKSLQEKKKFAENKLSCLKNFLKSFDKGKYGAFSLHFTKTRVLSVDDSLDIDKIPEEFVKTKKELKKSDIKSFLEEGNKMDGFEVKDNVSAVIR